MAKGGYRPGAGRPKGSKTLTARGAGPGGHTPLAYMLEVMNDETADPVRRDRMAIAAAPFVHSRPSDTGKKTEAVAHSKVADAGTDWEGLLQ